MTQPTLPGSALLLKMRSEAERSPAVRCCSGGPSAPELAVPAEKKMSVADSFAGFADSMASIASLPAEAQKDMIEYVRDLRELLAGGMLTGAGRLDFSLQRATGTLPCSAPHPHRRSCGALLLCLVCRLFLRVGCAGAEDEFTTWVSRKMDGYELDAKEKTAKTRARRY